MIIFGSWAQPYKVLSLVEHKTGLKTTFKKIDTMSFINATWISSTGDIHKWEKSFWCWGLRNNHILSGVPLPWGYKLLCESMTLHTIFKTVTQNKVRNRIPFRAVTCSKSAVHLLTPNRDIMFFSFATGKWPRNDPASSPNWRGSLMEVNTNWDQLLLFAVCADLLLSPNSSFSGVDEEEVATCSEVISTLTFQLSHGLFCAWDF
jgi:hypothetical protein